MLINCNIFQINKFNAGLDTTKEYSSQFIISIINFDEFLLKMYF